MIHFLYTIGCSTLSTEDFIRNLKIHSINALADVRSVPYSRHTPHFNKEPLSEALRKENIFYIPMAKEFGARREEPEAYTDNKVDFAKTAELPLFKAGMNRIDAGLQKGLRIALMCTEKDPLDCHRYVLVGRALEKVTGATLLHIHTDGSLESKEAIEDRLLHLMHISPGIFEIDKKDLIEKCFKIYSEKMGWKK